ncbi:MAG: DUF4411 family protein [Flavobacteriales bacterium]|nr:DUF4411 family protein [Flavobacteriales bacterium]
MSFDQARYCIDANVLIQAWQKYYSPKLCPSYWEVLNKLGAQGRLFIPAEVSKEIKKGQDQLAAWLESSNIVVRPITGPVTQNWSAILAKDPKHQFLVDNTKGRSLADPWVIAHAMTESAVVVTKEEKLTAANSDRIKIPNVCEAMNVRCITDFEMLEELGIKFSCTVE